MRLILETERLQLRELGSDDLDFIAEMLAHPEVMHFWPKCYSRDEARDWIRRHQERYVRDGFGYWLVVAKADGQPIGQAGLLAQEVDGVVETGIGYMIHRPFWRQGYATEAAIGCREHAFSILGLARITALVRPGNLASQKVALKVGLKPERVTVYAFLAHILFAASNPAAPSVAGSVAR